MGMKIGRLYVRRSTLIQASPPRVWQEFESFERIAAWLDRGHELHTFEPKVRGRVDFSVEIDGKRQHYGGLVRVHEPGGEVSFESQWEPPKNWPAPTFWTVRLTPCYDGTSRRCRSSIACLGCPLPDSN